MSTGTDVASTGSGTRAALDSTRTQLRGSSLLLVGRFISLGLNFVSQVLIVRYLSKNDYGAFAYALAAVGFFDGLSSLGLKRGIARFAPLYHERREWDRLYGSMAVVLITIAAVSLLAIGTLFVAPSLVGRLVNHDPIAVLLLSILIFMVPLEALDELLVSLFATFTSPRAIFFRKHLLAPALKLGLVALLVKMKAPVAFMAWGTLAASLTGVAVSAFLLVQVLRRQEIASHLNLRRLSMPWREMYRFAVPLMTSDLVNVVMASASTFFLGYFYSTAEVAAYRVVHPAARMNLLVMTSFQLLYMPQAARLLARGTLADVNTLYWRTAVWMAVLSFPVFALTFSLARSLTVTLYGAQYESSWHFMQLLSLGFFFNVVTGFNGLTLKVLGRLRYIVTVNVIAIVLSLGLDILLIPRWGALGAAVATTAGMMIYNLLKQAGLRQASGLRVFDWQYALFYLVLAAAAALLAAVQALTTSLWIGVAAAAAVSLGVLWMFRARLHMEDTFPELRRVPGLRTLLFTKPRGGEASA